MTLTKDVHMTIAHISTFACIAAVIHIREYFAQLSSSYNSISKRSATTIIPKGITAIQKVDMHVYT